MEGTEVSFPNQAFSKPLNYFTDEDIDPAYKNEWESKIAFVHLLSLILIVTEKRVTDFPV